MFIYSDDIESVIKKLNNIFGIHDINIAYEIKGNVYEDITKTLLELLKKRI